MKSYISKAFFFFFLLNQKVLTVFGQYSLDDARADLGISAPQHLVKSNVSDAEAFVRIFQNFGNGITGIVASVAVLFLVYNAFNLVTAAGETDKITKSKKGIIWSLVGLVVIIGAYVAVKTVISFVYAGETVGS